LIGEGFTLVRVFESNEAIGYEHPILKSDHSIRDVFATIGALEAAKQALINHLNGFADPINKNDIT
jgi:hypothetical protein